MIAQPSSEQAQHVAAIPLARPTTVRACVSSHRFAVSYGDWSCSLCVHVLIAYCCWPAQSTATAQWCCAGSAAIAGRANGSGLLGLNIRTNRPNKPEKMSPIHTNEPTTTHKHSNNDANKCLRT